MRRPQISIAGLALAVLVAAFALGAIRGGVGSPWAAPWAGFMWSVTTFALVASLLGIALGRSIRRAFWAGFATLGWSYVALMLVPLLYDKAGQHLMAPTLFPVLEELRGQPVEEVSLGLRSIPPTLLGAAASGGGLGGGFGGGGIAEVTDFVRIGMAIEALLWAYLGGWAATYFASGPNGASGQRSRGQEAAPLVVGPAA